MWSNLWCKRSSDDMKTFLTIPKWKFLSSVGEQNKLMKYFLSEAFDIYWKRRVKRENKKGKKERKIRKAKVSFVIHFINVEDLLWHKNGVFLTHDGVNWIYVFCLRISFIWVINKLGCTRINGIWDEDFLCLFFIALDL